MTQIHQCSDQSDAVTLNPVLGLFLKPIARINVSVHFPTLKQSLPTGGKSVSSWEVMEKIKGLVAPENFISLKVVKNTLEFIRFEGDLENRSVLKTIVTRLEGRSLKLTGFKELLKIRAAEAKVSFPSKYDWDSFFRDARHMNEMKAGERPDTIHFQCLPSKWFSDKKTVDKPQPSEKLFRRVWEAFGEVRCLDIPVLDEFRQQMQPNIAGVKTFTFSQDPVFEAYVQYKDYLSFVKAMDALRGCFLMYQEGNKSWVASIKVGFDKSKHLSEESIRKRNVERDRLMEEKRIRERAQLKEKGERSNSEEVNKSNGKSPEKVALKEESRTVEHKIALEERMYMVARRKLESIRLLDYLFDRMKSRQHQQKETKAVSERSSRSDRLSPSFYTAERSPRIDRSRSPPSRRHSHRSSSPTRSNHRSSPPRGSTRGHNNNNNNSPSRRPSPSRERTKTTIFSRQQSSSPLRKRRSRSRSRSRSFERIPNHSSVGYKSPGRHRSVDVLDKSPYRSRRSPYRDTSSPFREPAPRSPPLSPQRDHSPRRGPSPFKDRSPRDAHNSRHFHRSSGSDRSPSAEFRRESDRHHHRSYYDNSIPGGNSHYNYLHDWELKSRKIYVNPDRGRGSFRGRVYRNSRGRGRSNNNLGYNYHTDDSAYLQEAYNNAYTRYFNSISKTSDCEGNSSAREYNSKEEGEGERTRSFSPQSSRNKLR